MSEAIHNPHDKCFKTVMQNTDNARAFFQHNLEPALRNALDLDSLELQSGTSITKKFKAVYSDILYRINFRNPEEQGAAAYIYTIIEHQSTADPEMALRLLQYKIGLMMRHAKEDYLPPIHTMIFYHGKQTPYPYNLDLRTQFRTPEQAEYTLQGPPQLINTHEKSDTALLQQDQSGLFSYFFKHVHDADVLPALAALPAEFLGRITQHTNGMVLLENLMCYYQSTAKTTHPTQAFQQIADKLEPHQQEHIMYIGEALIAQGRQEGMQLGKQEGIQLGKQEGVQQGKQAGIYAVASNMFKEGSNIDFIRRVTGLPLDIIKKLRLDFAVIRTRKVNSWNEI